MNSRSYAWSRPVSSNRQIAGRLVISFNTAKTHIHNISKKLNAKTRTQAIARLPGNST